MPDIEWSQMFLFTVSPFELMIRGTLIYFFLFFLFRFFFRRDAGSLSVSDLLVVVIIADAAQNGMSGEYKSIVDSAVLISTIIGWSILMNFLSFHFKPVRRLVLPHPVCIVKDGVRQKDNLRRELITDEELDEMMRVHEVDNIADIKRAYLEPDGQITIMRKEDPEKRTPQTLPDTPGA